MAPFPDEVDLFSIPHSRMKRLVEGYSTKVLNTDFASHEATQSLLQSLYSTFSEFLCHEKIENEYIIARLKCRLHELAIYDYETLVCKCHADSRLSEVLRLVQDGQSHNLKSSSERVNYGEHLAAVLRDFTSNFLPHMEEEEEVFQPMLVKYFEYDELRWLKEKVIEQHKKHGMLHEGVIPVLWSDDFEVDTQIISTSDNGKLNSEEDFRSTNVRENGNEQTEISFDTLPPELAIKIFSFLKPSDLVRCATVCRNWTSLVYHSSLWHCIFPVQWARGDWSFFERTYFPEDDPCHDLHSSVANSSLEEGRIKRLRLSMTLEGEESRGSHCEDDCDTLNIRMQHRITRERFIIEGIMRFLIPCIGVGIHHLSFAGCVEVESKWLTTVFANCHYLKRLDLSYTGLDDTLIKMVVLDLNDQDGCNRSEPCCPKLQILDLAGCHDVTDIGFMQLFAILFGVSNRCNISLTLRSLNLSGCSLLTDQSLRFLSNYNALDSLQSLDLSGCWNISGNSLNKLVDNCPAIDPEHFAYCDQIVDGPFQDFADGCRNVGCKSRLCCRLGD